MVNAPTPQPPTMCPTAAPPPSIFQFVGATEGDSCRHVRLPFHQEDRVSAQVCEAQEKCGATRVVVFCKQIPGCCRKQC